MTASARPPPRRRAFWLFVAAMALAVLGGGSIVLLTRRSVREYRAEQARVEAENAAALEAARGRTGAAPAGRAPSPGSAPREGGDGAR